MHLLETESGRVAYTDQGQGDGVVLIHGFAASGKENWERAGWISMLTRANRRVIAVDLLGHGLSDKPTDPAAYSLNGFAKSVLAVVEHLQIKKPDLIGFSLGARVALQLIELRPQRFLLGVLCGVGERLHKPRQDYDQINLAGAMEAESTDSLPPGLAKQFRQFAEAQGQDLKALAACIRGLSHEPQEWSAERLSRILNEVLVVAGSGDELAGSAPALARMMANAKGRQIPGCGHMDCLTQPMFKAAVMDFLAGIPA